MKKNWINFHDVPRPHRDRLKRDILGPFGTEAGILNSINEEVVEHKMNAMGQQLKGLAVVLSSAFQHLPSFVPVSLLWLMNEESLWSPAIPFEAGTVFGIMGVVGSDICPWWKLSELNQFEMKHIHIRLYINLHFVNVAEDICET